MKRCPECRRDYYDDSLMYCLDDGSHLVDGPASYGGPATPIPSEQSTGFNINRDTTLQIHTTNDQTAVLPTGIAPVAPKTSPFNKKILLAAAVCAGLVFAGFFGYKYLIPDNGPIRSIAVLAFENKGGDMDADYLTDGLAESIIYRLSKLPDLKVSPTSSVFRYKGKDVEPHKIAGDLGVDAVMSGRFVQRGENLAISVELIDARTNKLIWGEHYERRMSDLLSTQREIVTAVTEKLLLKLAEDEQGLTKKYTGNSEAYQLYLRGRYHYAKRTKDDIGRAIEYFEQAIKLDPNFALAYVGIADAWGVMPSYGYLSPKEAIPNATAAARKALAIDPFLAEAHASLGYALAAEWKWSEIEPQFKRALELDPKNAAIHFRYAVSFLTLTGRNTENVTEMERAVELEPLSLVMNANLASAYMHNGQRERALEQAKRTFDLEPSFVTGRNVLGLTYNYLGMYQEAIALSEESLKIDPTNQYMLRNAAFAYAKAGRRPEAEQILERLREIGKTRYVLSYSVACVYVAMDDKGRAFAELEKAFAAREWDLRLLKVDRTMDPLRDDPRFKDLYRRVGLPE